MRLDELLSKARDTRSLPPPTVRRALRQSAGLSQHDVAVALEPPVDAATVCRWENGHRHPRGRNLTSYARLLRELERVLSGQTDAH